MEGKQRELPGKYESLGVLTCLRCWGVSNKLGVRFAESYSVDKRNDYFHS